MNDWILLGLIAAGVFIPGSVVAIIIITRRYYNHWATVIEADSSGHFLPFRRYRVARRKKNNLWHLKFFDRFIWNWSHQDKDFRPFTENKSRSYLFFKDNNGFLHDFRMDWDSVKDVYKVKAVPSDVFATQQAILHDLNTTYNPSNWFTKYGPWIVGSSLGVLFVFALLYWGYTVQNIADTSAGVADRCFDTCVRFLGNHSQNLTAVPIN